uniref:Actin-related protein 6 n=1 Tax=Amorphochlora amoebiformis TaxID=1561963 RepID=A0A7S0DQY0_9EUKA|mmetsp:Transcript_6366/g.9780  ORF Transcript_6366/g.9780 Transcript_6366/m.9780 type:complete len:406 (+) Transcript_6366:105-1322(+)
MAENPVIVMDNGGYTCKFGLGGQAEPHRVVSNCAIKPKRERRFFVADQIDEILDFSQVYYRRPCEKGHITNWNLQAEIWERIFKHVLKVDPSTSGLLVTEPVCNLTALSRRMDEIVFEKFGFSSYCRIPSPSLALYYTCKEKESKSLLSQKYSVVVDCGYSFSHVVPFIEETPINYAIKRVAVGGKMLTNYLKEVVSYRAFSMMDETYLMNHIKHKVSETSLDFKADLKTSKLPRSQNRFKLDYVLPTHEDGKRLGYIKPPGSKTTEDEQVLRLSNEVITIPELLFNPSLIGINQGGIAESIVASISKCHPDLHGLLYNNIILTGGSSRFKNFRERLEQDLRALTPSKYDIKIVFPDAEKDPSLVPWKGGSKMVACGVYEHYKVTKKTFEEYGTDACKRKFYFYT